MVKNAAVRGYEETCGDDKGQKCCRGGRGAGVVNSWASLSTFTQESATMIVAELPLPETDDGLFERVGLAYSFGLGVALVDCHKRAPDVVERA